MDISERGGPYITSPDTIEKNMWYVSFALIPAVIASVIFFGFYSLYLVLGTALFAVIIEFPFISDNIKKKIILGDGSAFLSGVLLGLTLPPSAPWWIPPLGAFLAIVIAKQLFGGLGNNIFNPALAARAILVLAWPGVMTGWLNPFDGVTTATPLVELAPQSMQLATEYWQLFIGNVPGTIGETSALALLIGAIFLYVKGYIGLRIPGAFIVSAAAMAYLLGIDPLFTILSGGLMLGALYMATDMVTSPVTKDARLIYGIGCGVFTVLIRHYSALPGGVTFAILLMNGSSYLFDTIFEGPRFGEIKIRKKRIVRTVSVLLISVLFIVITMGATYLSDYLKDDAIEGYTGSGRGMNSLIEVRVELEDDKISAIEVLSHSETAGIAEPAFTELTEKIITEQSIEVDTVSGATASSRGFLAAVEDALEETQLLDDASETMDGYQGSGEGMYDQIEVVVNIENGEITEIEVLSHSDTADIAEPAFTELIEKIITEQSVEVDTVSGATASSRGFLAAVEDALEEVYND